MQALRSVEPYLNLEKLYVLGTNCVDNGPREGLATFLNAASKDPDSVLHYEFMQVTCLRPCPLCCIGICLLLPSSVVCSAVCHSCLLKAVHSLPVIFAPAASCPSCHLSACFCCACIASQQTESALWTICDCIERGYILAYLWAGLQGAHQAFGRQL